MPLHLLAPNCAGSPFAAPTLLLQVLSTALFDKPAFKNLIVNGLVLAEDGKKMSKRLQNYPDPMTVRGG